MSANPATTTPTATGAPAAPAMNLHVTEPAAGEIKKFMTSEEGVPEPAGLRARALPGGCSRFHYSCDMKQGSRRGDFILDEPGVRSVVHIGMARTLTAS